MCPIARAEDIVGDRWTVLVLRQLFMRNHRYDEIQAQTGGTPQMVAARLKSLEADGMVQRRAYSEAAPRSLPVPPQRQGRGVLLGGISAARPGETWCKSADEGLAARYTHKTCGQPAGLGPLCGHRGELLSRETLISEPAPAYVEERAARREAFKGKRGAVARANSTVRRRRRLRDH